MNTLLTEKGEAGRHLRERHASYRRNRIFNAYFFSHHDLGMRFRQPDLVLKCMYIYTYMHLQLNDLYAKVDPCDNCT